MSQCIYFVIVDKFLIVLRPFYNNVIVMIVVMKI